jgi:hypothetical protein
MVGSRALHMYTQLDLRQTNSDIDWMTDDHKETKQTTKQNEILYNPIAVKWRNEISDHEFFYTLKLSHTSHYNNHKWDRHVWMLHKMRQHSPLFKTHQGFLEELKQFWETEFGPANRANLKLNATDFFNGNILNLKYDHDKLHEALVAIPAYKSILVGEVETSELLHEQQPIDVKIRIVQEETMVMGWERKDRLGNSYRAVYRRMLKNLILNHLPEWQAEWAVNNYELVQAAPFDFINLFDGLAQANRLVLR